MNREYMDLTYELNRLQWENYTLKRNHDLNRISKRIHEQINSAPGDAPFTLRERIERNPHVSELRNRLDDWDNYAEANDKSRLALARSMREDVLSLMNVRDAVARALGFRSYVSAIMHDEGLDEESVRDSLNAYLKESLPRVTRIVIENNIAWDSWFADLGLLGRGDLGSIDTKGLVSDFVGFLELGSALDDVEVEYGHDICFVTKTAFGQTRVSLANVRSVYGLQQLFHEIGHALFYHCTCQERESDWFHIHRCVDESVAVLFEWVGFFWMQDEGLAETAEKLALLEYSRTALSGLLELDLWETKAMPESLYVQYYSRLGVTPGHPELWCVDSFRSIDAVYVFYYTLGHIFSHRVQNCVARQECDMSVFRMWLKSLLRSGGRLRYSDMIDTLSIFSKSPADDRSSSANALRGSGL